MGRWAWCSDAWDFDHDGYSDLYIANGYVSGVDSRDASSFFWRQVVGKSPSTANPSEGYEHGWNAINELIRSDSSWSGSERNVLYLNNRDGTFFEVSGAVGLDFPDDSRSFVLADLDHDGRQEMILKNRNAPQLRLLRNSMKEIGSSIVFRLRGQKSNRDAIGASVTVETEGHRQTKYLQAGSGFLAQHSKELFFGVGKTQGEIRATIRWPSGQIQAFERLPVNRRIEIQEGLPNFHATPFAPEPAAWMQTAMEAERETIPSSIATWLIQPLAAPGFSLADLAGDLRDLQSLRGNFVFLLFWASSAPESVDQLRKLRQQWEPINGSRLRVVGVNTDDPVDLGRLREFGAKERLPFPNLLATSEVTGIYNILYRFLFDRHRDMPVPCSFLIDSSGMIVKVYQGIIDPAQLMADLKSAPHSEPDRIRRALPFAGLVPESGFHRNDFTYGIALFQRGYLDQAAASFKQVIAAKPDYAEAYYNLGTLCLRSRQLADARRYLEQAVQLRADYPEAWNNLGMIAAEQGHAETAIDHFQHSLSLRPNYAVALLNLGNLYRSRGNYDEAAKLLLRALEIEPNDAEVNYGVGMLYARQDKLDLGLQFLERAVQLRPDYPEALNNMGVSLVRAQRYAEAEDKFRNCISVAPSFDQAYLNLARLYAMSENDQKARATLQQLLKIQPENKMAQQALEMLH
jgi:tetratricopeptide (TPR) repeat protein